MLFNRRLCGNHSALTNITTWGDNSMDRRNGKTLQARKPFNRIPPGFGSVIKVQAERYQTLSVQSTE